MENKVKASDVKKAKPTPAPPVLTDAAKVALVVLVVMLGNA